MKPLVVTGEVPNVPKIFTPQHHSNVVDTKYEPVSSLITFIEGSSWTVDYYSQIIDKSNALSGQDSAQSGVYQQYRLIHGFEIKVTNSLNWVQDSVSKSMNVTGAGHIHSLVIPNEGDMFLADVGDGREGVFQIIRSEKKSLLKESVYYVEYQLTYFSDINESKKADLDSKVVQELHYSRDFLEHGQNPLLIKSEHEAVIGLKNKYKELVDHYFRWFYSSEFRTLLVPEQPFATYDHFVTTFMSSILNTNENEYIRQMRRLNVDDDYYLKEPQLYSAILNKDKVALITSNKKMGLVSTRQFSKDPMLEGIRYTGVRNVVYPLEPQTVSDTRHNRLAKTASDLSLTQVDSRDGNIDTFIPNNVLEIEGINVLGIRPVLTDSYYVLSENFYENKENKTSIELFLSNYFNDKKNNAVDILKLCERYYNWGGLERFYYIPIILTLIKSTVRGL